MARLGTMGLMVLLLTAGLGVGCGGDESDVAAAAPAPCGSAMCGASEYCCDAACGLCVPAFVACTETCP